MNKINSVQEIMTRNSCNFGEEQGGDMEW